MSWGWLVHEVPDRTYLWEIPTPLPPYSLTPPPRHRSHALGQRAPKPTIRSWLEGGGPPPPTNTTSLDTDLTPNWTWGIVILVGQSGPLTASDRP